MWQDVWDVLESFMINLLQICVSERILNMANDTAVWWHLVALYQTTCCTAVPLLSSELSESYWLRSFSNLDRSRSIRAKRSAFFIKPRSLRRIWEKTDLVTPISAAHYDQKDVRVLFHRTGSIIDLVWQSWIDPDWSRFEKERNHCFVSDDVAGCDAQCSL